MEPVIDSNLTEIEQEIRVITKVTAENKLELLNYCKSLCSKGVVVAILAVMLFASFALHQQQSLAQDQPQQQTLSNRTAINIQEPVKGHLKLIMQHFHIIQPKLMEFGCTM
jgi:hypothetical protein